jgi:hypothetical protein
MVKSFAHGVMGQFAERLGRNKKKSNLFGDCHDGITALAHGGEVEAPAAVGLCTPFIYYSIQRLLFTIRYFKFGIAPVIMKAVSNTPAP